MHKPHLLLRLIPILVHPIVRATPLSITASSAVDGFARRPSTPPGSSEFWWRLAVIAALVLAGGCFAGLTLGLMGLDIVNLQVLATAGTFKEQNQARRVLNLLRKGRHWVLVVLLLSNVIVNESLPIFLDSVLGGGALAVFLSTALIFIFGEIIPQSLCARYGLAIGSVSAPFVLFLMWVEAPVAWPLAKLLDCFLGEDEGTTYRKAELKQFVSLHRFMGEDNLNEDEVTIINAVLELNEKTVEHIMTPIEDLYTLSSDALLDDETVTEILTQGYSRIPIHKPDQPYNFVGMLLTKKLITYDPEDALPVSELQITALPEAERTMTCLEALNYFQQGRSHMLLVSEKPGTDSGALGVVSLEDVIEEMIGEEIIDETDIFVDVHNKVRVVRKPTPGKSVPLVPYLKDAMNRRRYGSIGTDTDFREGLNQHRRSLSFSRTATHPPLNGSRSSAHHQSLHGASSTSPLLQRVRVKGHDTPPLRSDLAREIHDRQLPERTDEADEEEDDGGYKNNGKYVGEDARLL